MQQPDSCAQLKLDKNARPALADQLLAPRAVMFAYQRLYTVPVKRVRTP
jgi:hypothetical protein